MTRKWFAVLLLGVVPGVVSAQKAQYQDIPEEDEDIVQETEYTFNPIQAEKELKVGDFYWKKGSYEAAAGRYEEATKWDSGLAEAFFKLGRAKERLAEKEIIKAQKQLALDQAKSAYEKYIELEPKGKKAKDAHKHIARLEHP